MSLAIQASGAALLLIIATACDSKNTRRESGEGASSGGLHSEACSDIPVTTGSATWQWVIANEDDSANATLGLSTTDLAISDDSLFYIADGPLARVVVLDSLGKVRNIFGRRGAGPGEFFQPSAIALDAERRIYVGDVNGRITILSPAGAYIRSFSVPEFVNANITGIVPLANGRLVVAVDARPREARGAYVRIVDSAGVTIRDVLMLPSERVTPERPLLAHELNRVRLSTTSSPTEFAVWYPMDNYVQVFDTSGEPTAVFEGCLPDRVRASYASQRAAGSSRQSIAILTLGIHFESQDGLHMASYDWTPKAMTLRVRRYVLGKGEVAASDYDISDPRGYYDRIVFAGADLLAFKSSIREYGIRRYSLDRGDPQASK
jgi:hypothetical protein